MDNEKIYEKICLIHSDVSHIKTKQEAQDRDLRDVEMQSGGNEKFINKIKGGLILISSGLIIVVLRYYMLQ